MLSIKFLCVGIISMMLFQNGESCTDPELEFYENGLHHKDIPKILHQHNQYRQAIMDGTVPGQPKGIGLKHLKWDDKLAKSAQEIADKCIFEHSNYVDERWRHKVCENLHHSSKAFFAPNNSNWTKAIESWFSEHIYFRYGPIGPGYDKYGHYTAMIWADTELIGCGYAAYDNNQEDTGLDVSELYVCHYGPPGNYYHRPPYQLAQEFYAEQSL